MGKGEEKAARSLWENSLLRRQQFKAAEQPRRDLILLFLAMLAFKLSLDVGYVWLTEHSIWGFSLNFSPIKYAYGFLWCIVLFFSIRHNSRKASAFFLYLMFLLQMVPITTAYAFSDNSTVFYTVLCLSSLLCNWIVGYTSDKPRIDRTTWISKTLILGYAAMALLILAVIVAKYGLPSLKAMDLFGVYELRGSGAFDLGKFGNYLYRWTSSVILPAAIALCLTKRKYVFSVILSAVMLAMYLYSANKTYLFAIPLVFLCTLWSRRKNFYKEIFLVACWGCALLVVLLYFCPVMKDLIQRTFSLLVRRVMLVPANNKFHYYDYFSNHPLMGLGGIFPRWLIYIPNYYENIPFSFEISAIYYDRPEMNSNTGFLAEGFMRFGHVGTVMILVFFALILKQIDHFQDRTSYSLAVGIFIYQIYSLSDAHLLDSLVLGPWMLLLLILLLCGGAAPRESGPEYLCLNRVQIKPR